MLKNAIIFDILYTPYKLAKNATNEEIQKNANERAFYNMTDNTNIYKYMTTEGKIQAKKNKKITALEYLQKSTGVFNQNGMIPSEEVDAIKERAKNNKGCIWHGFISLSEEDSPNIDNPEKCIELVKNVFGKFFKDANFKEENIDLMCALHLDKPHHLHIHYMFFEKEPRFISRDGKEKEYRKKGKVDKKAIDRMLINIAEHIDGNKGNTFMRRDRAIKTLKELTKFRNINASKEDILEAILDLKKDLPKEGRLSYGAKEMEPFRDRVDNIVRMIVENNREAQDTNHKFYSEVEQRRRRIKELCNTPKKFDDGTGSFRYQINESNITVIDDIEKDYTNEQLIDMLGHRLDTKENFDTILSKVNELVDSIWIYLVIGLGSVVVIWGAYIGIKVAIAKKKEEKIDTSGMVKGLIIGIIICFVLAVGMPLLIKGLASWVG